MNQDNSLYLEGLASYGVVFTQITPGTKRTTRTWEHFENLHEARGASRLDLVHEWLRKGYGVGYLLRGGLAAIDADDRSTVQRITDFEEREIYLHFPKVQTPSGGIHAHFQHPPDLDLTRVKNHICHPLEDGERVPWDFKLNTRTMLMAPGTQNEKGIYQAGIWLPPPILDVRYLAPELEIFKVEQDFIRDTRPLDDRIMAAMSYLKYKAPVSREGFGRRRALRRVAEYLVPYLGLDPSLAFYLLTTTKPGRDRAGSPVLHLAWNERCLDAAGKPSPWSDDDLWNALEDAVDAVPLHGVLLLEAALEKQRARTNAEAFLEILTLLPQPTGDISISKDALYQVFLDFSGVSPEIYDKRELGLAINDAIRLGRLPFLIDDRKHSGRIYRGMDKHTLRIAMGTYEQQQKAHASAS